MMEPQATIIIPTFDHADTLYASVRSVLLQSVSDIEIFIIGDGVPDKTRQIASELMEDERVRFFDHPKSPRHGEEYRHMALKQARGKIVCYLCDDDLWFPDHVEHMLDLLKEADFANAVPLLHRGEGVEITPVDLSHEPTRTAIVEGVICLFGPSQVAHTMEFYRRLPYGWRTTPADTPTDQYMWRQCLSVPDCKAVSGFYPTVIGFPAASRKGMTSAERRQELEEWLSQLLDSGERAELRSKCLEYALRSANREMTRLLVYAIKSFPEERQTYLHLLQQAQENVEVWKSSHLVQEETVRNWQRSHQELLDNWPSGQAAPAPGWKQILGGLPVVGGILRSLARALKGKSRPSPSDVSTSSET